MAYPSFPLLEVGSSEAARNVLRGTLRLLLSLGYGPHIEVPLGKQRRADIVAVGPDGELIIVEVKSCRADFISDHKWSDYVSYADKFLFAVPIEFPLEILGGAAEDDSPGIIVADRYSAEIVRPAPLQRLNGNRRAHIMRRLARLGARRMTRHLLGGTAGEEPVLQGSLL